MKKQKPRQPISAKADGGSVTIKQPEKCQRHPLRICRPVVALAVSMTLITELQKLARGQAKTKTQNKVTLGPRFLRLNHLIPTSKAENDAIIAKS